MPTTYKELKTKLLLRQHPYSYWTYEGATPPASKVAGAGEYGYYVPFYGEVCICEVPSSSTAPTTTLPPTVLFKVGNGADYFKDLNWASALAADVYDWAKDNALAVTTSGSGNVVTNVEWDSNANSGKGGLKVTYDDVSGVDTNTTYNFSIPSSGTYAGKLLIEYKEIGDSSWIYQAALDIVTPTELTSVLSGYSQTGHTHTASNITDFASAVATAAPVYSVVKLNTPTSTSAATYQLAKDGTVFGTKIEIPKDMVVSSGSVQTYSESGAWGPPGTYIVLVLANATSDTLYINVDSLIEEYTSGSASGDAVTITIDNSNHKISASLSSAVQTSLGKADTAVQSVVAGTANGTIKVDGTDINVTGLDSAAYQPDSRYLQSIAANDTAQKASGIIVGTKTSGAQTVEIDDTVVFILNGNYSQS